jgi:hypothetical protein
MKRILLVGTVLAAFGGHAHSEMLTFSQAVARCRATVQHTFPTFDAYVLQDGTGKRLAKFGSAAAHFAFEKCMNEVGQPIVEIPPPSRMAPR